ncbi:trypsin-like peptidase domain-containing protein [Streptomyces chrestomyceticus]|uniref:trypsin-like peptidase domain-containing protein n=1 Tax=Streptomyces chrestomyceticus TaxID=68185 RepID=UPI0037B534AD
MRRTFWLRATTLGVASLTLAGTGISAAAAVGATPPPTDRSPAVSAATSDAPQMTGTTGTPDPSSPEQVRKAKETERYWTPERIRSAVPVETAEAGAKSEGGQPAPGVRRKRSAEPTHQVAEGIATVGVFLLRGKDGSATPNQFCTASTVTSGSKSLVVTAAHCIKGNTSLRDAAFVPGYRAGTTKAGQAGEMPYGIFPVLDGKVWVDHRYQQSPADDDVDFAFLRVGANAQGQLLEDAAGPGNTLTSVDSAHLARESITAVGYPGGQKTPLSCTNDTRAFQGRFMEIQCDGYRSGVSGGPFIEDFDGTRGKLVGVIGGYKTGGLYDHTSYTSQFDDDAVWLYRQAVADLPLDGKFTMGGAGTWQHARAMTAGSFHSASVRNNISDLIVRWSDGEVSLYPGNGTYGFGKDVQLAKDPEWNNAAVMTAGDFTGDGTSDLLVRWTNGKVTLYRDVNETNKLKNAVQLKAPNSTWTQAVGMAAGRFGGGNTRGDDVVVQWANGRVTFFTNVDANGFHAESRLAAPNGTWPHARDLAAGDFNPSTGDQDLFVRWSDGEVTVYDNVGTNQLKTEHQLSPAKSGFRSSTLAAVGAFGGDTARNDVVVAWPNGRLTLNGDTTTRSLARERTLVPAA